MKGKGDCFTKAWRLANEAAEEGCDMVIVHGLPVGRGEQNEGQRFWHAWSEYEEGGEWWVFDYSNDQELVTKREWYYKIGQIEEEKVWRYSLEAAAVNGLQQDTYGPWVEGWEEMGL